MRNCRLPARRAAADLTPLASSYLVAHFGKSLMWHGGNVAFAFYLTEICGQSPATMAWLLALSSIVNAVADGVIGAGLARRIKDGAAASRQQFAGSVAAGSAFAAFCAAGLVPEALRLGYALCTLFAFRIAYATVDVPQNALLTYIPADSRAQERLVASRMMAGYAAQVTTALLISSLLLQASSSNAARFALGGAAVGMAAILTALALRLRWGDRSGIRAAVMRSAGDVRAAPGFFRLLLACAAFAFSSTLVIRLQAYIAAFAPEAGSSPDGGTMTVFVPVAMAVGGLAGQPFWAALCSRHGVRATLRIASIALIGTALAFGASASSNSLWIAIATGLFGAALGGTSFALWALLARGARDGSTAMRFGMFTCTSKLAHALSAAALGAMLSGGDYRAAAGAGPDLWSLSMIAAIGMGAILLVLDIRLPPFRRRSSA